jgi:spore maturation protein CgeB
MGFYYRSEWVPRELNGIYHATSWENYLSYDKRKDIYLSSIFALGFHGDDPINCGSISQRVFEGMAYGCIVLSDNPMAEKITDGIVVTVRSKNDVLEKIKYFKENPDLIIEKQNKGYEWVKKYGTNRESIRVLLAKLKEIYNIEFD